MKAIEYDYFGKRFSCGMTIYPYQITFGFSLRYYPCIFMPSIRIHFLCFKFWIGLTAQKEIDEVKPSASDNTTIVGGLT